MQELINTEDIKIEDMIYEIRGKQVMLDSDIAFLFNYETFNLNKAVKRNINKFDNDYMLVLTREEYKNLIFQNGISSNNHGGRRTLPNVFTDKGILMLATILKSDIAIEMSIRIINTFVSMRKYISSNLINQTYYNNMTIKHDSEIKLLQESFDKLEAKEINNHLFYEGQIYDAYSVVIDIFNKAKKEIIIIDNYLDKNMLDIISKAKTNVSLITANKLDNLDLVKYNKQYNNLKVIVDNRFHDRFIILDRKVFYHLGASLNSIGKKCFAIVKFEEPEVINKLLSMINYCK